jgi:ubiquitin-like protein Pup
MATRVRQPRGRAHRKAREESGTAEAATARRVDHADELKHDFDDLLDEIDEVLEENAEEFVAAFVQKGGQ